MQVDIETKDEMGALAESFRAIARTAVERSQCSTRLAAGDLAVEFPVKSDADALGKSLIQVVESLRHLVAEADALTKRRWPASFPRAATRPNSTADTARSWKACAAVNWWI